MEQNNFLLQYPNILHNSFIYLSLYISLKYYFFIKYKFHTYLLIFYKIPAQFPIKDKKMKDKRRKKNINIKIMYRETLLFSYTLGSTISFPMFREAVACDFL
jgi:hypothetical protein